MRPILIIEKHSVHLWRVFLPDLLTHIHDFSILLNENEMARANRFRFNTHRERYIIARALLRHILSLYTAIPPKDIVFSLGVRGKPYLEHNTLNLQFNVSHSHDMAVYAITSHAEIGVDIEKIEAQFNQEVAKRFFSTKEYAELIALSEHEQICSFYRLWAGKEAIIKALGEGLYTPLASFSLDLFKNIQTVELIHDNKSHHFYLENFVLNPQYQSAFATSQKIIYAVYWEWARNGYKQNHILRR